MLTGPRVLVLSFNYPSAGFPTRGHWVRRLVQASRAIAEPVVIAPLPLLPMGLRLSQLRRNLRTPLRSDDDGVPIYYPRTAHLPVHAASAYEERTSYPSVARLFRKLHTAKPFDLIHAHFIHPEGVIAARLGDTFGVPVVTTEHANWSPWLDPGSPVRPRVERVLDSITTVTAVSNVTANTVRAVAQGRVTVEILPNGVDETVFQLNRKLKRDPNRILFVGAIRHVKGLDVLVNALPAIIAAHPAAFLEVIGEAYFHGYQRDEEHVRQQISRLGLGDRVRFAGHRSPEELADELGQSALLVLPSRRESFGAVLIEAMACGTPVVSTHCGGPTELVSSLEGRLVEVENPQALADAIIDMLGRQDIDRDAIRARTVERYGVKATQDRLESLYRSVLSEFRRKTGAA